MSEPISPQSNPTKILDIFSRRSVEKLSAPDFVLQEFSGKTPEFIMSSLKSIQESGLLKRPHFPKFFSILVGETRRHLEATMDIQKLYTLPAYWDLISLENQAFLFSRGGEKPTVAAFAPGGSYGAFYLGYLSRVFPSYRLVFRSNFKISL